MKSKVFKNQTIPEPTSHRVPAPERAPAPRRKQQNKPVNHHKASRNVPPKFRDEVVVCFASGPGLTLEVVETVRPYHEAGLVRAAGLNDVYRVVDYLDVFYACDERWWDVHTKPEFVLSQPVGLMETKAEMWGNQTAFKILRKYPHVNVVQGMSKNGFSKERSVIHWGNNSGYQLLNLVYLMGAKKIILAGYNMGVPNDDKEKVHFFGKHPPGLSQGGNQYKGFNRNFNSIQKEIKDMIVNTTPETTLKCFEWADLETALKEHTSVENSPKI